MEKNDLARAAEELLTHSAEDVVFEPLASQGEEIRGHDALREFWAVDRVDVGETLATVQGRSGRTVAVGSPVRGALVELNPLLRRAPHALLAQPYGRGWVARISADRWERDEAGMVPARAYRKVLDADLALGREFCFGGALLAPRPPAEPAPPHQAAA